MQAFTAFVGEDVFERHPGGMRLTDVGRDCLETLEPTYRAMLEAARALEAEPAAQTITVSLSHSLAVGWLIPRIERFYETHPRIKVTIVTTRTAEAIRAGTADLGLCASDVDVAGLHAEHLLDVRVTPVGSREVAAAFKAGTSRLADHRLLTYVQHRDLWSWWAEKAGLDHGVPPAAGVFDMAQALYEAAAAGLGLAPGIDVIIGGHLESGRLVELGLPTIRYPGGYQIVARPSLARASKVEPFRAWLRAEAKRAPSRRQPVLAVA
jgi:DNA-binding transcriptional LysR family regulator